MRRRYTYTYTSSPPHIHPSLVVMRFIWPNKTVVRTAVYVLYIAVHFAYMVMRDICTYVYDDIDGHAVMGDDTIRYDTYDGYALWHAW